MVRKDSEKTEKLKKKSRRYSIQEGIFASAKSSFGDYFVHPFAIAINASNSVVALISAVSGLLGPLSQIFGSRLIEKYSRKKIMLRTVFLESLMWLPMVLIAFLFYRGILISVLPLLFLLSFSFYIILNHLGYPAWFSWTGDIVGSRYRGRWFSKRTLIIGAVSVVLAVTASFFLDYLKKNDWTMFGFIILFSLAFLSRLISYRIFRKQYEPKIKLRKKYYFSFWEFVKKAPESNFGKFAIFRFMFSFTCSVSAPLLAVYLLRTLGFSYSVYMIVTFAGTVFSAVILNLWGKFSDKYGNYKILGLTCILIPIIPILWVLLPSPLYLIFVPSLISGISWTGFHLAERNFIYDNVSSEKRGLAVSYYNMFFGIGTFLGAGISALLIKFLVISFIEPIIFIFIIGSICRMIVVFFWIPKIKEIRKTSRLDKKSVENFIIRQSRPSIAEEFHEIVSIKDYLKS